MDLRDKALLVIEVLCEEDLKWKNAEEIRGLIYKIAHSARTDKTCQHKDWVEETEKLFKAFQEA
jgi:hypothetical protein